MSKLVNICFKTYFILNVSVCLVVFICQIPCVLNQVLKSGKGLNSDWCQLDDKLGVCKNLSLCEPIFAKLNKNGVTRELGEYLNRANCGFEGFEPKICCVESDSVVNSKSSPDEDDDDGAEDLLPKFCGSIHLGDRVIGGEIAEQNEFPWMALLIYINMTSGEMSYKCDGTLISSNYVLTAAHCVFTESDDWLVGVRLGEYNTETDPDCDLGRCAPKHKNVRIRDTIIHEGFSTATLQNDIALLRLDEPVNITESPSISPICLPVTKAQRTVQFNGENMTAAGWGLTEYDGTQSPILLKVSLPIVQTEKCKRIYQGAARITNNHICAGAVERMDVCKGDSGGPLMYVNLKDDSVGYVQYGIVSFGHKYCGAGNYPGIFTRVAAYMDWILEKIKK